MNRSEDLDLLLGVGHSMDARFIIDESNELFYFNMLDYFKGIPGAYDINKGLLICGDIGTGKTFAMKLFQKINRTFEIVTTRHIIRDYFAEKIPSQIIDKYGRKCCLINHAGVMDKTKPRTVCFDDFGLESVSVKNYGNEQNILEEIMLDRYDMALSCGMKTYITTNLDIKLIEQNYGARVRDRFRETMNYITLTGKTKRK